MPVLPHPSSKLAAAAALRCSLGFAAAYTISNHLTGLRAPVGQGVFGWEQALIPFVPWTVVPYLSLVPLFWLSFFVSRDRSAHELHIRRLWSVLAMSLICYALVPLQFTYARPATAGLTGLLFELLGALDRPFNRAPSLHIGVLVLLWAHWRSGLHGWQRVVVQAWFALIAASVLTTYQHHVIDVPAGIAVALLAMTLTQPHAQMRRPRSVRNWPVGDPPP